MQNRPSSTGSSIPHAFTRTPRRWRGDAKQMAFDAEGIQACLNPLDQPVFAVAVDGRLGFTNAGHETADGEYGLAASALPMEPDQLGDASFRETYGVKLAYASGAMANAIASVELVTAMGRAGLLSSFGAAGVVGPHLEAAIQKVQEALPTEAYAFNLIHSPSEEAMERLAVELFLRYGVTIVEASAYIDLTPHVVRYRAAGLTMDAQGELISRHRIIAKVSRRETAQKFMEPAPKGCCVRSSSRASSPSFRRSLRGVYRSLMM